MIMLGFKKSSPACHLSVLTTEDLGRMNKNLLSSTNKRYLVLSYNVEFDKINYPLPLEWSEPTSV